MTVGELVEQLSIQASEVEEVVIMDDEERRYHILAVSWVNFRVRIRIRAEKGK